MVNRKQGMGFRNGTPANLSPAVRKSPAEASQFVIHLIALITLKEETLYIIMGNFSTSFILLK